VVRTSAGLAAIIAIARSSSPEAMAWNNASGAGASANPLWAARRRCSSSLMIATISSYPRSVAMVSGLVASRCGYIPARAFAPWSISTLTISGDRFRTASSIPPLASSGRTFSIARTCTRSPARTASEKRFAVTPSTYALSLGQLS
jgi:hypothetical protein